MKRELLGDFSNIRKRQKSEGLAEQKQFRRKTVPGSFEKNVPICSFAHLPDPLVEVYNHSRHLGLLRLPIGVFAIITVHSAILDGGGRANASSRLWRNCLLQFSTATFI